MTWVCSARVWAGSLAQPGVLGVHQLSPTTVRAMWLHGPLTSPCTSFSQRQVANISEPYLLEVFHYYNDHRWAGPWPELSLTCWNEIAA